MRWHSKLTLCTYTQDRPTRHYHLKTRASIEKIRHLGCRIDHLLEVVEEQQHVLLPQFPFETIQGGEVFLLPQPKSLDNDGYNHRGIAHGSQVHEIDSIREQVAQVCRHLQAQPGLACAAGSRQSH